MANVFKTAKTLQRQHPKKYANWQQAVKAAGRKLRSKKQPRKKKKKTAKKKVGAISTRSKSHIDKNRNKVDIQIGKASVRQLENEAKKKHEEKAGDLYVKLRHHAKGVQQKKKIRRQLAEVNKRISKLS